MPLQMALAAPAASFSAGATATTGDEAERLGALFDRHHPRLYRLARRLCQGNDDASDVVQETFLRAARAPASVPDGMPHEEAWLVRVLVNICRDRWRKRASRTRLDPRGDAVRPLQSADPEAALIARSLVWRALDALPPRRRAMLVMYELEGATVPAIARLLGVSPVTVRWHLARGRREMAAVLKQKGPYPFSGDQQ
jgi:RNA polymerase sigma-70 factor (ECF subfamily)